jgi:pimeloyl-ACP methyl ester carboxylesterase
MLRRTGEDMSVHFETSTRTRLLAGLPVTDRNLTLAGLTTAVLEGGSGPPVILLHSAGEFAALWARILPDLVKTHRVVVPDLPGHGASPLAGQPRPDQLLEWLAELIEQTCTQAPSLVGHGLGGALAARFATDHSRRIDRLVLVDSLGLAAFEPDPSFARALTGFVQQPTEETRDALFAQCFVNVDRLRTDVGERWQHVAAYALDRARTPDQQAALAAFTMPFGFTPIEPADLARIGAPTAMIWGRHDLQVPIGVAEEAGARYGWPLHVIDAAGDDPAMEQPVAFLAALRAGLATPAPDGVVA